MKGQSKALFLHKESVASNPVVTLACNSCNMVVSELPFEKVFRVATRSANITSKCNLNFPELVKLDALQVE